jgi:protein-disulfide isomerase
MHFPMERIHSEALKAAEASECAGGQGRFWEMHESLFSDDRGLSPAALMERSAELGLDASRFEQCLNENETLERVRADQAEGRRLGVTGTPAFFIGTVGSDGSINVANRIRGAGSIDLFNDAVASLRSSLDRVDHHTLIDALWGRARVWLN